jgi:hypothetical protein
MAPQIISITGSPAASDGSIAASPEFGGSQSVHVRGANFETGLFIIVWGPNGTQGARAPQIQNITATDFDALLSFPIRGAYVAAVFNPDNTPSAQFSFHVS